MKYFYIFLNIIFLSYPLHAINHEIIDLKKVKIKTDDSVITTITKKDIYNNQGHIVSISKIKHKKDNKIHWTITTWVIQKKNESCEERQEYYLEYEPDHFPNLWFSLKAELEKDIDSSKSQ